MKYSVLMSVYYKENPDWLKYSLESMLAQTIKTDDFVLVEDGPLTPKLERVIEEYKTKYPNIFNVIKLDKNYGLGKALSCGVSACKNDWIARMDSDDYSVSDRLEKQLKFIEQNPKVDMVGSFVAEFENSINEICALKQLPVKHEEIIRYSKMRNPFGHPSMLLRKSKVLEAGNYRDYYLVEDWDMWIRMFEKGAFSYNIPEILVYMRIGQNFYKRRGGIKYLKSILKFKKEQYKKKYFSLGNYIISSVSSIVVCLLPNSLRDFIYRKILRKRGK